MTNSRAKGARGELDWCKFLKGLGIDARRSQQYCGTGGDADVISDLPIHWEVKRQETVQIHKWMDQAVNDATDAIPAVAHRKNRTGWLVTLRAEDFVEIVRKFKP